MPLLTGSAADAWFRHFFVGDGEHIHSFYALVNFDCSKIVHSMLFKWRERKKERWKRRERERRERENKRKRGRRERMYSPNQFNYNKTKFILYR